MRSCWQMAFKERVWSSSFLMEWMNFFVNVVRLFSIFLIIFLLGFFLEENDWLLLSEDEWRSSSNSRSSKIKCDASSSDSVSLTIIEYYYYISILKRGNRNSLHIFLLGNSPLGSMEKEASFQFNFISFLGLSLTSCFQKKDCILFLMLLRLKKLKHIFNLWISMFE